MIAYANHLYNNNEKHFKCRKDFCHANNNENCQISLGQSWGQLDVTKKHCKRKRIVSQQKSQRDDRMTQKKKRKKICRKVPANRPMSKRVGLLAELQISHLEHARKVSSVAACNMFNDADRIRCGRRDKRNAQWIPLETTAENRIRTVADFKWNWLICHNTLQCSFMLKMFFFFSIDLFLHILIWKTLVVGCLLILFSFETTRLETIFSICLVIHHFCTVDCSRSCQFYQKITKWRKQTSVSDLVFSINRINKSQRLISISIFVFAFFHFILLVNWIMSSNKFSYRNWN